MPNLWGLLQIEVTLVIKSAKAEITLTSRAES